MEKEFRAMRVVEGVAVTLLGTIGVWALTLGRDPALRLLGVAGEPKVTASAPPASTPAARPSPRVTSRASATRPSSPPVTPTFIPPAFPAVLAGDWPAVEVAPVEGVKLYVRAGHLQVAEDGRAKWSFELLDSGYVVTVRCLGTFRAPYAVTGERRSVARTEDPSVEPSVRALLLFTRLSEDDLYAYLCEGTFDVRYEGAPGGRVTAFEMADGNRSFTWSRT